MTAQPFDLFVQVADELYMQTNLIEPEYVEEMHGIAQGASANGCETTFGEILAWNCFVDIIYSGWSTLAADYVKPQGNHSQFQWLRPKPHRYTGHRCSAFIATGDATQSGEIVMAHTTWDAFIQAQHFNVIVYIQPEHGESLLMQTAPGWIASMMDFTLTGKNLMVTETTIDGYKPGFDKTQAPEFVTSRKACQYAATIDDWVDIVRDSNNGGYANSWLLGDADTGEIARCELGLLYQSDVRKLKSGILCGQNIPADIHIRNLETDDPDAWSDISGSGARRVRWKQLTDENYGKVNTERARLMIGDHYDVYLNQTQPSSRTLCGHIDIDDGRNSLGHGHPPFYPWGAVDGKVATSDDVRNRRMSARWGRACGEAFNADDFLKANLQYDWLREHLIDRPSQPWEVVGGKK